jgi:hypothetical protein
MAAFLQNRHSTADDEFLVLSKEEIWRLLDQDAQKLLGISGTEFLRRRAEKRPLNKPAWTSVEMLAHLLD